MPRRPRPNTKPPDVPVADRSAQSDPAAVSDASALTPTEAATVKRAYSKVVSGQELTRPERALLVRYEKGKEERLRWQYYRSIPQKHWRQMSGRQTKVLAEQAARYDWPFGGRTIDLTVLAKALHDFLADNAYRLSADDDPMLSGTGSPALERYREERAALARLDRLERERDLIARQTAREALGRIAMILRGAGETLRRQFGAEPMTVLNEALDDAEREIGSAFGSEPVSSEAPDA